MMTWIPSYADLSWIVSGKRVEDIFPIISFLNF